MINSMKAIAVIERALSAGALEPNLISVPSRGATDEEIEEEEALVGQRLSESHKTLLRRWNGIDLEVLRLFGCGPAATQRRLSDATMTGVDAAVVIGDDPFGFVYFGASDGRIILLDTDGGAVEEVAADLDDFICRLVFGADAASFAGDDWFHELRVAGIIQ